MDIKRSTHIFSIVILITGVSFNAITTYPSTTASDELKMEALNVLRSKCNVCHKKQNPFMVFNAKNMTRRSTKINNAVFVTKRMPKGDTYELTDDERTTLKNWLDNQ